MRGEHCAIVCFTRISKGGAHLKTGRLTRLFFAVFLVLACAGYACASEGHEPRWGDFAWRIVNLILFCGILWYFTGNLCKRFFKNRKQAIQDTLNELEQKRVDAKEKLAEIEKRIANLEAERKAILDESRAQAERLKQGIMEDAKRQADQIVDQAKRTAENEGRAMLDKVRSAMADEIVDAASKALRNRLTPQDHEKLIENAMDKVALQ